MNPGVDTPPTSIGSNTSKVDAILWTSAMTASKKTTTVTRGKKQKPTVHPEFEEAAELITDPYWKEIFISCSKNKFPRGFQYVNHILQHKNKNLYTILDPELHLFIQGAISFFQQNERILSEQDIKKINTEQGVCQDDTWQHVVRSKNRRAICIRKYVNTYFNDYPKHVKDNLFTMINICYDLKIINSSDIQYHDRNITNIDGISIDGVNIIITKPYKLDLKVKPDDKTAKDKNHQHLKHWLKFLKNYMSFIVEKPISTTNSRMNSVVSHDTNST